MQASSKLPPLTLMSVRTVVQSSLSLTALVVTGLATSQSVTAASLYSVTDLSTLPGFQYSSASDINERGLVVGSAFSNNAFGEFRAFLWDNGVLTNLGTLPGYTASSTATGINDLGQVVGSALDRIPSRAGSYSRAFLWSADNGMINLGTFGGYSSGANAINNLGQVVGASDPVMGSGRAFRTAPNSRINPATDDLGTLPNNSGFSGASDINNLGQVVGYISTGNGGAFLWENGVITNLGFDSAIAINDLGQIVGSEAGVFTAGVLWENGVITNLGTLGGGGSATDINNLGQIVGGTSTTRGFHAYLWENGVISDLNDLIPADSGWELASASAINDRGQIVGEGTINGERRAYLLTPVPETTPVPEPSGVLGNLTMGAFGAGFILKRQLKKRKLETHR